MWVEPKLKAAPTHKLILLPVRRRVAVMKRIASFVFIAFAAIGVSGVVNA
jgi:hypothetical protein